MDLQLSEVALGTWGLASGAYGPVDRKRFEATVDAALEAGVNTFDMAPLWGDGASERVIGERARLHREDLTFVTRGGAAWQEGKLAHRFDAPSLRKDCEASLERLGTDRVDLWLLHNPPETLWSEEEWRKSVDELKQAGKIRAWGASVATADHARMALRAGAEALCLPYNMLASDDLDDLSSEVSVSGCGILACSPLFHGLLAGRWSPSRRFLEVDHRRKRWTPEALELRVRQVERLRFLVHDEVRSMTSAAIRFVLSNSVVTAAVVGARAAYQVTSAASAAEGGGPYLPEQDLARIPQVLAATGGP